jgi:hypothetical protein
MEISQTSLSENQAMREAPEILPSKSTSYKLARPMLYSTAICSY